jgi:hypothetical protein
VLVAVFHRDELVLIARPAVNNAQEKSATVEHRRQHTRRVRYPERDTSLAQIP